MARDSSTNSTSRNIWTTTRVTRQVVCKLTERHCQHSWFFSGSKNHQCYKCGKKFSSSSILAKHVGRHSTRRDFRCSLCPKAFVIRTDLSAHVKFVHERAGRGGISDRPVFPARSAAAKKKGGGLAIPPNYSVIEDGGAAAGKDAKLETSDTVTMPDGRTVPYYEKPRPVLRMVATPPPPIGTEEAPAGPSMTTRSMSAAVTPGGGVFPATDLVQQSGPLPPFSHPNQALEDPGQAVSAVAPTQVAPHQGETALLTSPPIVVAESEAPSAVCATPEEEAARLRDIESQRQIEEWMISEGVSFGQGPATSAVPQQQQQQQVIQPPAQTANSALPCQAPHVALKIPNPTLLSTVSM